MSTFAVLFFCLQACLIQSAFGCGNSCGNGYSTINNAAAINAAAYNSAANNVAAINAANNIAAINAANNAAAINAAANNAAAINAANSAAAINAANAINSASYWPGSYGYSAYGSGDVAVSGELGVSGSTTIAGSVPVTGGLTFSGLVPASGLVTISGGCTCPQSYAAGADLAELAVINAGLSAYPQSALYGAGLAQAELNAELASINRWNGINSIPAGFSTIGCGCNGPF
ncbi:hypothetical protein O0L34_g13231 [Tuta absoluta]|nr:hypothetical protein O0L34_g13231 [Tuta absoluta]